MTSIQRATKHPIETKYFRVLRSIDADAELSKLTDPHLDLLFPSHQVSPEPIEARGTIITPQSA